MTHSAALKVQCVRFVIIHRQKWNIIYGSMFSMVYNYGHIAILVLWIA